jgi:hypothetical protein
MRSKLEFSPSTDDSGPELVTLADLKLELNITTEDQDDTLQARITRQSRLIAEACNRVLALSYAIETFTFDSYERMESRQGLNLSLYPIASITLVTEDGAEITDYEFDSESGRLWRTSPVGWTGWPGHCWGGRVIAVSYSGGYALPDDAPASLQAACIQAVADSGSAALWNATNPAIQRLGAGDQDIRYFQRPATETGLSSIVADLIRPFRRPALA